ncbi:MAG TPA: hypothetical protein IAC90_06305 [Candidatus Coproplasma stercorigallinarum]|nr:hypothetical protein [Candidatus Coproplasma stercorigallinarum]
MTKKTRTTSLILLLVVALLAAIVAGTSVSRYVFDSNDNIVGNFTNLYFSHNGDGTTAIMEEETTGGDYVGYISLTAFNYETDSNGTTHVTPRQIQYRFVGIETIGLNTDNTFTDDWGTVYQLTNSAAVAASTYYTVEPVDESGSVISENLELGGQTTTDAAGEEVGVQASDTNMIKITRNADVGDLTDTETFYIIIEITSPYQEYAFFEVDASTSLIAVANSGTNSNDTYFGYDQLTLNIQTAREYGYTTDNNVQVDSSLPAMVTLTWTSQTAVIFDYDRLITDTEDNFTALTSVLTPPSTDGGSFTGTWPSSGGWHAVSTTTTTEGTTTATTTVTLFLPQASNLNLYFYVPESYTCKIAAWFYDNNNSTSANGIYTYTEIAGADGDRVVAET